MRYPLDMVRRAAPFLVVAALVVACAAESSQTKGVAPAGAHPAEWFTIGNARNDFQGREHDVELAGSDCQAACKALASLERAANHLCAVAEPEECTDARVRADRARRAVTSQCGSC
jgi:hypothetical protein